VLGLVTCSDVSQLDNATEDKRLRKLGVSGSLTGACCSELPTVDDDGATINPMQRMRRLPDHVGSIDVSSAMTAAAKKSVSPSERCYIVVLVGLRVERR